MFKAEALDLTWQNLHCDFCKHHEVDIPMMMKKHPKKT